MEKRWEDGRIRCSWANPSNLRYIEYHDSEWGIPVRDDGKLYEMLLLECFQAGLSWECILNKRDAFRKAFDGFDAERIASYGDDDIARLTSDPGIVRNRAKIVATIGNAKAFLEIQREFGSFSDYLWGWTDGKTVEENTVDRSPLSDSISEDLKKRGMRFVGSVTVYSYLQAVGVIWSHQPGCFLCSQKVHVDRVDAHRRRVGLELECIERDGMAGLGGHGGHLLAQTGEILPLDYLVHVDGPAAIEVVQRQREEPVGDLREVHDDAIGLRERGDDVVRIPRYRDQGIGMVVLAVHDREMLRIGVEVDRVDHGRLREPAHLDPERGHAGEHVDDDLPVLDLGCDAVPLAGEPRVEVHPGGVGVHPGAELLVDGLGRPFPGHQFEVPDPQVALDSGIGEHAAQAPVGAHHGLAYLLAIGGELVGDLDHTHVADHVERYGQELGQSVREAQEVSVIANGTVLGAQLGILALEPLHGDEDRHQKRIAVAADPVRRIQDPLFEQPRPDGFAVALGDPDASDHGRMMHDLV